VPGAHPALGADRVDGLHLAEIARLAGDRVERLADSDRNLRAARRGFGCMR
jgi:hypothetical protein